MWRPTPGKGRRLAKGMAAAGVLSLAVHGAVLLGRMSAGSGASNAAPQAPVLLTRSVVAPNGSVVASLDARSPVAVPADPIAAPATPKVASDPRATEHEVVAVAAFSPALRPLAAPALAVPPSPQPELAATPMTLLSDVSTSTYLGSAGLDPPPRPLSEIDPVVPAAAGSRGGIVVLRLFINELGGVDKAEVLNAAPPGLFDASALDAFTNAKFSPGYFAGVAVKSQVTFEVKFLGLGSGAETSGRTY